MNGYRVTHTNDIVVHYPKAVTHDGYHHTATEVYYDSNTNPKQHRTCDNSGEDPNCSNKAWGNSMNDHRNYLGYTNACDTLKTSDYEYVASLISDDNLIFFGELDRVIL